MFGAYIKGCAMKNKFVINLEKKVMLDYPVFNYDAKMPTKAEIKMMAEEMVKTIMSKGE